jgi:hypothetical protein
VNISRWQGLGPILARGADTLSLTTAHGPIYEDLVAFLNGHGSLLKQTLNGSLPAGWSIQLVEDMVVVKHASEAFTVTANNIYGFTADTPAVEISGVWTATAQTTWTRGPVSSSPLEITPSVSAALFRPNYDAAPTPYPFRAPSVIHLLRPAGAVGDVDDNHDTDSLQRLISEALFDGGPVSVGLTGAGRVWIAYPTGGDDLVFPDTDVGRSFRHALGFSESAPGATTVDGYRYIEADEGCEYAWSPERPLMYCDQVPVEQAAVVEDDSGAISSISFGEATRWMVKVYAGGPASAVNEEPHVRRFMRRLKPGYPVTLYRNIDEPRRAAEATFGAYSVLETPECWGEVGRIRGYLAGDGHRELRPQWETSLRLRFPIEMILSERSD